MKHIPEDILLLGLVVKTIPFTYSDNVVNATFSKYLDVSELEELKIKINELLKREGLSDADVSELNSELYLIDEILINLGIK